MTLFVHRSHEMERLAARFASLAFVESNDLFESPVVVVQGQGMERWLAQFVADTSGVFAGVTVTRVRAFVTSVCDTLLGASPDADLDAATLVFRVAAHLDAVVDSSEGAAFAAYARGADAEKKMQLVERLAEVLDRAFVHRPETIARWASGTPEDDETKRALAALVRAVLADAPGYEGRRVAEAALRMVEGAVPSSLPKRVHLFGVGTLAPLYLSLFRALARVVDVHFYVLSPGETWLSDLDAEESAHGEIGSLVRGFAKLAAEFQDLLEDDPDHVAEYLEGEPREPRTMLEVLQHDLRTLTQRGEGEGRAPRVVVDPDDRSFVVHACHSPLRELEVLHEVLIDRLDADPSLRPSDIAVLTADVDRYAPFIHSVFGRERERAKRIPYHVADRGPRASFGLVDSLFVILDSFDGRATLPSVADLLERGPIRERFGLAREDVESVVDALRRAGARWGLDAGERRREGMPGFVEHTFAHALDRLALGFAVGESERAFHGIAPEGTATTLESSALGAVFELVEQLAAARRDAPDEASVPALVAFVQRVLETFLDDAPPFDEEASLVRTALRTIAARAEAASFAGTISRASLARLLLAELDEGSAGGFLGGGVTFCRQVPMRAIPFRIVCLLGLDDGLFPRDVDAQAFDFVSREPKKGDRSARDDDRQTFLDTILSARDALHLFHVGRDIVNDTTRPVSAVVSRTLDVLDGAVVLADGTKVRDHAFVAHPLHAFDPSYFAPESRSEGLVSRDATAYAIAAASLGDKTIAAPTLAIAPREAPPSVELEALLHFLRKPADDFLTRVLGMKRVDAAELVPDREPLVLEGLDEYGLLDRALELVAGGVDVAELGGALRRLALLPPGASGEVEAEEARAYAEAAMRAFDPGARRDPVRVDLDVGPSRLVGVLHDVYENGSLVRRASKESTARHLETWVRSLVLSLADTPGVAKRASLVERTTVLDVSSPKLFVVPSPPPDEARRLLGALVEAFLAARSEPVLIVPAALDAYSNARAKGASEEDAAARAEDALEEAAAKDASLAALLGDAFAVRTEASTSTLLGTAFRAFAERVYAVFDAIDGEEASS